MVEIITALVVCANLIVAIAILVRSATRDVDYPRAIVDHTVSDMARLDATVKGTLTELHEKAKISGGRMHMHDVEVILSSHYSRNRKG